MSLLFCPECGNTLLFRQTSARDDERTIDLGLSEPRFGEWLPVSLGRPPPGVRCGECGAEVPTEFLPEAFADRRVLSATSASLDLAELTRCVIGALDGWTTQTLTREPRSGSSVPVPPALHEAARAIIARVTGGTVYGHQAEAIEHALSGRHVVQATSAGSGKTLSFVAPILDASFRDERATALLVYPSAALIADQLVALRNFADRVEELGPGILKLHLAGQPLVVGRYDGAANDATRLKVRRDARLVMISVDSLHAALLRYARHHYRDGSNWQRFYRGLRYVVVDEVHQYRGAFGAACAMVFRRLRRMATAYGAMPTFIGASATIGNPAELFAGLTGLGAVTAVDRDTSPHHPRTVVLARPSLQDGGCDAEEAVEHVALALVGEPEGAGVPVRSLTFAPSRRAVVRCGDRIEEELSVRGWTQSAKLVRRYVGTLDAEARASADADLRDGTALVIVSTNALELGIDVPSLGAAILIGLPDDAASFEQRSGRVGRHGPGVVLVLLGTSPLERMAARSPEEFGQWLEGAHPSVQPVTNNAEVVRRFGLVPAQVEMNGISAGDARFFGQDAVDGWLIGAVGAPTHRHGAELFFTSELGTGEPYVGLRGSPSSEAWEVVHEERPAPKPLGTLDRLSAMVEAYPGAIWRGSDGDQYVVVEVRHHSRQIVVERSATGLAWRGVLESEVAAFEDLRPTRSAGATTARYVNLRVTFSSRRAVTAGPGPKWHLIAQPWPDHTVSTTGLRLDVGREWFGRHDAESSMRALANAIMAIAPSITAVDRGDLRATFAGRTLFVHDAGGSFRWAEPLYIRLAELAALAWRLTSTCECITDGCAACVADRSDRPVSRAGATDILYRLMTGFLY